MVEVEVHIVGWAYDRSKNLAFAKSLYCESLFVNGNRLDPPDWELRLGGFVTLTVYFEYAVSAALHEALLLRERETREWAKQFTPDQYLADSDETKISLLVSKLTVIQSDYRVDRDSL